MAADGEDSMAAVDVGIYHDSQTVSFPVPSHTAEIARELIARFSETSLKEFATTPEIVLLSFINYVTTECPMPYRGHSEVAELMHHLFKHFDTVVLGENDIHVLASSTEMFPDDRRNLLHMYYTTSLAVQVPYTKIGSYLFRAAPDRSSCVYAVFGGQGNTKAILNELRHLDASYGPLVHDLIVSTGTHLRGLAKQSAAADQFLHGLDIVEWLDDPAAAPSSDYMLSAPVSFPLIGLLQFVDLKALLLQLNASPKDLPTLFNGFAGHSQGLVVAAVAATATSWEEYQSAAMVAITTLFWIGVRSQQCFSDNSILPSRVEDIVHRGDGVPSPMLAVAKIQQHNLDVAINQINEALQFEDNISIALTNSHNSFVVGGPRTALAGLSDMLHTAPQQTSQHRTPFSQRKSSPSISFLPVTAPFHSKLLASALPLIEADLADIQIHPSSLTLPVNHSSIEGSFNLLEMQNIVPHLARMVVTQQVFWTSMLFPDATHIVDFGPGGTSGVGAFTKRNLQGTGARVIISSLQVATPEFGSRVEILDRTGGLLSLGPNWKATYSPSLVQTANGLMVDSRLSRLLGLPPFMIAGMTPTTCNPQFVSAAMRAGFHVEVGGGGYTNPEDLTAALESVRDAMPLGRKIAVNVIYVNPKAISWQIPLIKKLRANGFPIASITIGAGIPSLEVATEYITTLGLEFISFKPGSVEGIKNVLDIARENAHFPIVIQWTGGRGGGHHSLEDFHQPILDTYHDIRQCENVVLVAGSGFGFADQMYPYLTGTWSLSRGKAAPMPFDGILLGSRVMACKEAHTSNAVKECIAALDGVEDSSWEGTLKGSHGGVISVTSEMGEAIHVVATRGALFWDEMDRTVFNLPKGDQLRTINMKKNHIINKLNEDFQKVWFGEKRTGPSRKACELDEMTYIEVLRRMVELMFIQPLHQWIDVSYWRIFRDFLIRTEERHAPPGTTTSIVPSTDINLSPSALVDSILTTYPGANEIMLTTEDVHYFLKICQRRGQKPVPFVPILDSNFETWFKKDSLWQSENLEAVTGQDAGRVFILHGPVAAQSTAKIDETIKDVMDSINDATKAKLLDELYDSDEGNVRYEEYLRPLPESVPDVDQSGLIYQSHNSDNVSTDVSSLSQAEVLSILAGKQSSWKYALFRTRLFVQGLFVQGQALVENPIRNMLAFSVRADLVEMSRSSKKVSETIRIYQKGPEGDVKLLLDIENVANVITVQLFTWISATVEHIPLILVFEYNPENAYAPISERTSDRDERIYNFYERLWTYPSGPGEIVNHIPAGLLMPQMAEFENEMVVDELSVRNFVNATKYRIPKKEVMVPLSFSIVLGWKAISRALLQRPVQGDLLRLVHLSNRLEAVAGVVPLSIGDKVGAVAQIHSISLETSGKVVQIGCELRRDGTPVVKITTRFLIRGSFPASAQTFSRRPEDPFKVKLSSQKDVSVLVSKSWFFPESLNTDSLLGAELLFKLNTVEQRNPDNDSGQTITTGTVISQSRGSDILVPLAKVNYRGAISHINPVTAYLSRWGKPLHPVHGLDRPITIPCNEEVTVPVSNESYSRASGDFNPIHTSAAFASYVGLPGTITHGMFCSAQAQYVLEKYAADGDGNRVSSYDISFVDMVLPGDVLVFSLQHTAMIDGLKVIRMEVRKRDSGDKVLEGEAHIKQPPMAIIFTGQGNQEKSMGMALYETSPVARQVWDQCDAYFESEFGFRISTIVRENPTELTIPFGGHRGRILRQNYMNMACDVPVGPNGATCRKSLFPEINEDTTSYQYRYPDGLLFATQFVQPALVAMEIAAFKDLDSRGLISAEARFAGHSLGEYAALFAIADLLPLDKLMYVIFCRGLTMQQAVERDNLNRSSFGMVAVDPSRVAHAFTDATLKLLVDILGTKAGYFIEIVNYNVRNSQYVCAGDRRALDCLQRVLDDLKKADTDISTPYSEETLSGIILKRAKLYDGIAAPTIELHRGQATVPLAGLDVPFHSSKLRPMMEPFRTLLSEILEQGKIKPDQLVGKYVPNLTGRVFAIDRQYFEEVFERTGSERLRDVLERWEDYWEPRIKAEGEKKTMCRY